MIQNKQYGAELINSIYSESSHEVCKRASPNCSGQWSEHGHLSNGYLWIPINIILSQMRHFTVHRETV